MRSLAVLTALATIASAPSAAAQPARSVQITQGANLYATYCALCHGADGRGGQGFQTPIWGQQTQIAKFSNALGLFEYNQLMMPFDDPTKLNDDQKLAITAYILVNHGALPADQTLAPGDAASVPIR